MKNTFRFTLLFTAAFSYLFYCQNAGINFLVFDLLLVAYFVYLEPSLLRKRSWLISAVFCLVSGWSIVMHSSMLAVFANLVSLLLLSAYTFRQDSSMLVSLFFSFYSLAGSLLHVFLDVSRRPTPSTVSTNKNKQGYVFFTVLMGLLLVFLFFIVYRQANPLFAENTKWLNLDFISLPWFVFTLFGFFVVYGLLHHKRIAMVEELEFSLNLAKRDIDPEKKQNHQTEINTGLVVLLLLNLMLLILNVGDIRTLFLGSGLPPGLSHADFVHHGVALVILSILIAIGLIVFLSRKDFRSLKNNTAVHYFVYFWILQNLVMVGSTAYRNHIYVETYSLTQLRVGVYVWLVLAAVGLILTFWKLRSNANTWYLVKSNVSAWLFCLVISSTINWDVLITRYNLNHQSLRQVDFSYLFSLADSNLPDLLALPLSPAYQKLKQTKTENDQKILMDYQRRLYRKTITYLERHESGWQSWDLVDQRTIEKIRFTYLTQH